nr:MAG TPA: hypothetical protein [Bacteriophage sp.]DAR08039.1 MAG TPA: hypothetical protein [Caudoviricetes sp.]
MQCTSHFSDFKSTAIVLQRQAELKKFEKV